MGCVGLAIFVYEVFIVTDGILDHRVSQTMYFRFSSSPPLFAAKGPDAAIRARSKQRSLHFKYKTLEVVA